MRALSELKIRIIALKLHRKSFYQELNRNLTTVITEFDAFSRMTL